MNLLKIAIKVFAENGLDGTRHGDITKAVGVAIPTVHSYFKTRSNLISAVLGEIQTYILN